jgi:hypothetical protein
MPNAAEPWSLTSLREKLIKIGAKVVSHGRYVTFQMADWRFRGRCLQKSSRSSPGCGHHRRQHERRWGRKRQTTMGEVRLDAGKAKRPGGSGAVSPAVHAVTDLLLPKTPEAAILAQ